MSEILPSAGPRLDYQKIAPDALRAQFVISAYVAKNVDPKLRALVELRVSQLNGCAFCLNMHSEEARHAGEDQQRLDTLSAWHETNFFTDKERAALVWAETLTHLPSHGVPDDVYEKLKAQFTEKEIVDLTFVITTINAWNRLAISFQSNVPRRPPAA